MDHELGLFMENAIKFLEVRPVPHSEYAQTAFQDLYEYLLERADVIFYQPFLAGSPEWCARFFQIGQIILSTPLRFLLPVLACDEHYHIRSAAKQQMHLRYGDYDRGDPEVRAARLASWPIIYGPSPFSRRNLYLEIKSDRRVKHAELCWALSENLLEFVPSIAEKLISRAYQTV